MKQRHDYPAVKIGDSETGRLVMVARYNAGGSDSRPLYFGEDGSYRAYLVDWECAIPDYYKRVAEFIGPGELSVYDDHGTRRFEKGFDQYIRVYRSGSFGCIIQSV